jgi:membrane dipeptidase
VSTGFIVDAHNDLLLELASRRAESNPFASAWSEKLRKGGVKLQLCPLFAGLDHLPESALRRSHEQVAAAYRAVEENRDGTMLVRTRADLEQLLASDKLGLLLSMEGAEPFGYDPGIADVFWELGARVFGLTWNRRNPFADGAAEEGRGGLSRLGRELVERLFARGAVLDLAHAAEQTFADVLELAGGTGSVMVSHAACRAVYDTARNLSDEQLRELAAAGGVLGIMAHPVATNPAKATVEGVVDHVEHAVKVMGADAVGLGADFIHQVVMSGAVVTPPDSLLPEGVAMGDAVDGLVGPDDYPNLIEALARRGFSERDVTAIANGNFLRLLRASLPG